MNRKTHTTHLVALAGTLVWCTPLLLAAQAPGSADSPSRQTISCVRDIGSALFRLQTPPPSNGGSEEITDYDWSACPPVDSEILASLLVPAQLEFLPRVDGWGKPLQFCLDQEGQVERARIGVRSAGADGHFAGPHYPVGPFPPDEDESDIVWMDGYFVTWPQAVSAEG